MPPAATASDDRAARRGPTPLPDGEKRNHCVSVRLNGGELAQLDAVRGRSQRGEWLRMAALDQLPPTVPTLNQTAWRQLAPAVANLNQWQRAINEGRADRHQAEDVERLKELLSDVRMLLLGVRRDDTVDEDESP